MFVFLNKLLFVKLYYNIMLYNLFYTYATLDCKYTFFFDPRLQWRIKVQFI